jgi:hypothetical protein
MVYLLIQFLVKPVLRARYGVEGNESDPDHLPAVRKYRAVMNVTALALGLALGVGMAFVLPPEGGVTAAWVAQGAVTGLGGGFTACGLHETATNVKKAL